MSDETADGGVAPEGPQDTPAASGFVPYASPEEGGALVWADTWQPQPGDVVYSIVNQYGEAAQNQRMMSIKQGDGKTPPEELITFGDGDQEKSLGRLLADKVAEMLSLLLADPLELELMRACTLGETGAREALADFCEEKGQHDRAERVREGGKKEAGE